MTEAATAERPQAQHVVTSDNLAEFQLKRMGLAEPTPPAADPTPEPAAEAQAQSEPAPEQTEAEAQPEPERRPNPKLERRFSDLTKARKEAEAKAEAEAARVRELEAKLQALQQGQAPAAEPAQPAQVAQADAEPQPGDFSDAFEYARALAKWSSDQAVKRVKAEEADRKANETRQQVITAWADRVTKAKAEMPDFGDMVTSSEVQVTDAVRDAILESEVGPRILYHLAENPELGKKLAGMTVAAQLREIGKLEGRFEAGRPNTTEAPAPAPVAAVLRPRAAAPITPIKAVAAGAAAEVDSTGEFRGSYQQWKQMRRAGKIK
jgi:colicin import membrane protein